MSSPTSSDPSKKILGITILLLTFSLIVVGLATWFYLSVLKPTTEPLYRLKSALEKVTSQEIVQSGHSLEINTDKIQELAVIEREMQSITKYEASFLGAKKTLILRGTFIAKAGFDLTKADTFSIIDGKISGSTMRAELLSVELLDYEIYHSQDVAFNKLTTNDQAAATNQLLEQARKDAQESDLRRIAQNQFNQRLRDLSNLPL